MADRSSGRHRFRACLESTASYQDFTRLLIPCLKGNQGLGFDKSYVASTELEEEVLKVVFASRLSDIEAHKPTNIVTIIERASKIPSQKFLWATYKDLCEVAHPNFFGRSIYILNEVVNAPGDKIWTIGLDRGPTHRPRLLSDNGPSCVSTDHHQGGRPGRHQAAMTAAQCRLLAQSRHKMMSAFLSLTVQ